MKTSWIVLMVVLVLAGCSQVLGLKEPSLEEEPGGSPGDASMDDAPGGSDARVSDGPPGTDAPPDARISTIWAFTTTTQFNGGFGGAAPRTFADAKCGEKYDFSYSAKGCTKIHAVIQIDNSVDTLALMGANFQIPTTAPVLRAEDSVKVAERWADFANPSVQLLQPVTPSASTIYFWSGKGVSSDLQCNAWSSSANAVFGNAGAANLRGGWLAAANLRCDDLNPRFMCVCW